MSPVSWAIALFLPGIFRSAILVDSCHGSSHGSVPSKCCRLRCRAGRFRRSYGWNCLRTKLAGYLLDHGFGYSAVFAVAGTSTHRRIPDYSRPPCQFVSPLKLEPRLDVPRGSMKITEIRTRVLRWRGKTVPLPPHFCTNPMDLLELPEASMRTFTFHGWLVVEVFTDDGHVGLGNAALAPLKRKTGYRSPSKTSVDRPRPVGSSSAYGNTCIARRWRSAARESAWSPSARWISPCGTCSANPPNSLSIAYLEAGRKRAFPFMLPASTRGTGRTGGGSEALQGGRLPGHEASLRMGTRGRRSRHAAES